MTRHVMRASGEAGSRRSASLVLALERFDTDRVNEAIQASQAVVATVGWAQG
jgi:hypothetical protein